VRFQWSVPEPTRIALINSLAERFNASQKDFAVQIEYVPQAQARQKLISSVTGGSPPDLCQVWDNWVGQFNGMGAVEDITARAKSWKHFADVAPAAWQTVTINDRIISLPLAVSANGLPVGLMFSAALGQEARLLELAYELEDARPWMRIDQQV